MTVYVDELVDYGAMVAAPARRHGTVWCHMMADDERELAAFARLLGLRDAWIQHAGTNRVHFDLTPSKRALAIRHGARELMTRELIRLRGAKSAAGVGADEVAS